LGNWGCIESTWFCSLTSASRFKHNVKSLKQITVNNLVARVKAFARDLAVAFTPAVPAFAVA